MRAFTVLALQNDLASVWVWVIACNSIANEFDVNMHTIFFLLSLLLLGFQLRAQDDTERVHLNLWDIVFVNSDTGFTVGDNGIIQKTTDGGKSWSPQLTKLKLALRSVHFFTPDTGIAAGLSGALYKTIDAGKNWLPLTLRVVNHLTAVAAVGDHAWISGQNGFLIRTTNRGTDWKSIQTGTTKLLDAISFSDTLYGWASSSQGILLRTTDGGETWTEKKFSGRLPITDLSARSHDTCYAAGYDGMVMRTTDGGKSWTDLKAYRSNYNRMRFDRHGKGWLVGAQGAVVKSNDNGKSWRLHRLAGTQRVNAIAFRNDTVAVAVGNGGMIVQFDTR